MGGILRDHQGDILAAFGYFLGCQPILYAEFMAICTGLELATHLKHSALEVESDSTTVVSLIHYQGLVHQDYVYLLHWVSALISFSHVLIRHVLWEATSTADFMAKWACFHRVSRRFLCARDLPTNLSGILHLDAQTFLHIK